MHLTGPAAIFFWVFAAAALLCGMLTVMSRAALHCALFLVSTLLASAALFLLFGAEFVAGMQILVYVGGIMVLFLFVVMLVSAGVETDARTRVFNSAPQVAAALLLVFGLALVMVFAVNQGSAAMRLRDLSKLEHASRSRAERLAALPTGGTGAALLSQDTEAVGGSLYRFAALPFEIASLILLVAIVGAVSLARSARHEARADGPQQ